MREYIRRGFKKEQLSRENKKLTAILQALRNCHTSLGTIQGGEEKTLAIHAIAYTFEQVNTLRQMKGKAAARGLAPTETIDIAAIPEPQGSVVVAVPVFQIEAIDGMPK